MIRGGPETTRTMPMRTMYLCGPVTLRIRHLLSDCTAGNPSPRRPSLRRLDRFIFMIRGRLLVPCLSPQARLQQSASKHLPQLLSPRLMEAPACFCRLTVLRRRTLQRTITRHVKFPLLTQLMLCHLAPLRLRHLHHPRKRLHHRHQL
jgi:hypothetical protein